MVGTNRNQTNGATQTKVNNIICTCIYSITEKLKLNCLYSTMNSAEDMT